jgi:BMFP domain-containing protein YqiC
MMQNQNPLFEDLSRLMSSVAGTMAGAGREAEARMREKLREAVGGLDMVSRDEFEAVKAMAAETRAELEALKAEIAALKGGAPAAPKQSKARKIDIG